MNRIFFISCKTHLETWIRNVRVAPGVDVSTEKPLTTRFRGREVDRIAIITVKMRICKIPASVSA